MRHLLSRVALTALMMAGAPVWARTAANPAAGAAIIPPADAAAAKPAANMPTAPAAPTLPMSPTAPVAATGIRHDHAPHHRYVWNRRQIRRAYWWRGRGSDRVAEALNLEELHRAMPSR